jgi:hydrogenase 3 maturation protease
MSDNDCPRLAIVGIGHELRGDDAAGLAVARAMQPYAHDHINLMVIEAGPVPENFTGPLRRFKPEVVVLVDAAQMETLPGSALYLDWRATGGFRGSSHTLPLSTLANYLENEIGCEVWILGIQPENNAFGAALSESAAQGVHRAVENLKSWLCQ